MPTAGKSFQSIFGIEKVIQSYTHFDLKCIENIQNEIDDNKPRFQALQQIYKEEYDMANSVPNDLSIKTKNFLENEKEAIIEKNKDKSAKKRSRLYINFIYEQYGDVTSNDKNNITFNVACNDKSIEQDQKTYIDYLKPRFKTFMDELYKTKKDVENIFFGKKSNNMYAIKIGPGETSSNDQNKANSKKRTFETGIIPKTLNAVIESYMKETKLFNMVPNPQIIPDWISIDLLKEKDWNAYKKRLVSKNLTKGAHKDENEYLYDYIIFIIQELHKEFNLYEKKRLWTKTFTPLKNFIILYTIVGYQGVSKEYIFANSKTVPIVAGYEYFVNNHKITIEKTQSLTLNPKTNDIELKIVESSTYNRLYLKSKALKQGVVFNAKLYNINKPNTSYHGKLYKAKSNPQEKKNNRLESSMIFPETNRSVRQFLFIPGFFFSLYHIKSFHNQQSSNLSLNKFIIDICTNNSKMEQFYLFCLNHDKASFRETITFQPESQQSDKQNRKIIENQTRLMLSKDLLFRQTKWKELARKEGKYISSSIHKIYIDESNIETPSTAGKSGQISVNITLKERDRQNEQTKGTATDCKTVKKGVLNTIKSLTRKASNAYDIWKMDFDIILKNKFKTGGKRTKKYKKRKKHKKTRRLNWN